MSWISLLGAAAATSSTIAYLPQVIRTWRTRSTSDISLGMFSVTVWATALWLLYGLVLGDVAIILSNSLCLCLSATILYFKLRYG
jgi:MtN3 and saliva related transmembrane protein